MATNQEGTDTGPDKVFKTVSISSGDNTSGSSSGDDFAITHSVCPSGLLPHRSGVLWRRYQYIGPFFLITTVAITALPQLTQCRTSGAPSLWMLLSRCLFYYQHCIRSANHSSPSPDLFQAEVLPVYRACDQRPHSCVADRVLEVPKELLLASHAIL